MRKIPLNKIRNIGIIAHIDAGKTTTTERILYYTGKTYKIGEVDEGTATMDWMVQEQERGITITAACTTTKWRDCTINVIDTPGHVDFTVEVERSLKVLDGAVVVFCGVGGVEPQSETVWRQADMYNVPRIAYVNKMDRTGSNFFDAIEQMRRKLGANAAAIQFPYFEGDEFLGVFDLIQNKLLVYKDAQGLTIETRDVPQNFFKQFKQCHDQMLEHLAETDEKIMSAFVHGEELSAADIRMAIRKAVIANKFVPVLCGASFRNKGIQPLLDAICDYLPSPEDLPPIKGTNPNTGEFEEIKVSDKAPFTALCFKVATDPYVGKINYIRVYSGTLKSGEYVYNASKRTKERVAKLVRMHANRQEVIDFVHTGDIAAAVGLKETKTGDTICTEENSILLESMHFPEPVIQQAIEPKTKIDQERLGFALHKLAEEDPSFRIGYNQETGETIISGMGQLHLEIIIDRIMREFNVEAQVGAPQVAYRETITKKVNSTGKFIQQSGGRGQYGHVVIEMEPQEMPGTGITFVDKIKSGAIPKEFIPSVKDGIFGAAKSGILAGYPVTDVKVTLVDGSFHEVDSSEMAFQMAASIAFNEGLKKAASILLEPIMDMEVIVPEEYMGSVIGDLNARRAKIISLTTRANVRVIRAYVPLAEVFNYATSLRSLTQGRASYTMEPSFYAEVPSHIAEKIILSFSGAGSRKGL
ncbi:MAG: elongation factor G [Candidatus Omnitrophica bacterium]|nr:elongation factor G [Candidatus Omnitrophota bacterium]